MKAKHVAEIEKLERGSFADSLHQDRWWRSKDGWIRRKKMTPAHKAHALGWIEDNAVRLVEAEYRSYERSLLSFPDDPSDGVFAAMCGIEGEADRLLSAIRERDSDLRKEVCAGIVRGTKMYQALLTDLVDLSGGAGELWGRGECACYSC